MSGTSTAVHASAETPTPAAPGLSGAQTPANAANAASLVHSQATQAAHYHPPSKSPADLIHLSIYYTKLSPFTHPSSIDGSINYGQNISNKQIITKTLPKNFLILHFISSVIKIYITDK